MSSSMSSFNKDTVWIYHERQEAALCGQHALNNLVQSSMFTPGMLADVAHELDLLELEHFANNDEGGIYSRDYLERVAQGSHNVDEQGNFSIEVIRKALLEKYGMELPNIQEEGALVGDITDVPGFICNRQDHWFAIRKINSRFWNLNSTFEKPRFISDFQLAAEMNKLQKDGYSVFMVKTQSLPNADRNFSNNNNDSFWWKESDLLGGGEQTKDHWESVVGAGNRLDGKAITSTTSTTFQNNMGDLTEDEMMQMAMAASLEQNNTSVATTSNVTIPEEPPQGTSGVVQISFRLSNSKRVIRRFLETDSVSVVHAFAKQECGGVPQGSTLELRYGYPPKTLDNLKQTIGEANLAGELITGRIV